MTEDRYIYASIEEFRTDVLLDLYDLEKFIFFATDKHLCTDPEFSHVSYTMNGLRLHTYCVCNNGSKLYFTDIDGEMVDENNEFLENIILTT